MRLIDWGLPRQYGYDESWRSELRPSILHKFRKRHQPALAVLRLTEDRTGFRVLGRLR